MKNSKLLFFLKRQYWQFTFYTPKMCTCFEQNSCVGRGLKPSPINTYLVRLLSNVFVDGGAFSTCYPSDRSDGRFSRVFFLFECIEWRITLAGAAVVHNSNNYCCYSDLTGRKKTRPFLDDCNTCVQHCYTVASIDDRQKGICKKRFPYTFLEGMGKQPFARSEKFLNGDGPERFRTLNRDGHRYV